MQRPWAAEVVVDAALAAALIDDQFKDLRPARVEPLYTGWDNTVFRVNERFVFRFPRREVAVPLLANELRSLPLLAPRLPLPVPMPVFAGQPSDGYRWPFNGYEYIPGQRAVDISADPAWRLRTAIELAHFLKALHAIPPADLPSDALQLDDIERLSTERRIVNARQRLAYVSSAGAITNSDAILSILASAPEPSVSDRLVIAHGDLHVGQLLIGPDTSLAGVIDWGDIHLGDAGVDFAVIHQLLPRVLHDRFFDVYGPVDATTWALARARAAWHTTAVLASALDTGDKPLAAESARALSVVTA